VPAERAWDKFKRDLARPARQDLRPPQRLEPDPCRRGRDVDERGRGHGGAGTSPKIARACPLSSPACTPGRESSSELWFARYDAHECGRVSARSALTSARLTVELSAVRTPRMWAAHTVAWWSARGVAALTPVEDNEEGGEDGGE
jgi:hypothetical protein